MNICWVALAVVLVTLGLCFLIDIHYRRKK